MAANPPPKKGKLRRSNSNLHVPDQWLTMHKQHFLRIIDRLLAKEKHPHVDWIFIALGLCFGTLLALLPADFTDYGISQAGWEALAVGVVVISGVATVGLTIWVMVDAVVHRRKTSDQIYEEVEKEAELERQRMDGGP